ncbi:isocitrate lyase-family enzyme [Vreelandella olivaria]|uniref:Isocitrate lyase-family enzyme n=1 Tax=Vreelandella olivaria TaxID=390919 RepID=A0ABM7GDH9_9GAMM|nr:isocitrate lyase-family enzyme [Halomonas olivaria]
MTRQQIASQQASRQPTQLKQQLQESSIVVAPGVFDALGASPCRAGGLRYGLPFRCQPGLYQLGRPDIGLLSITEICTAMSHIRERTHLSVVVDCDTGFGNAMNVMRSVRLLERSGANAIQLEDQTYPKRCGHLRGKTLVSKSEMVGKLHAALDARESDNTLIIGRTDALGVEGTDSAIERAQAYYEAGVDMLFIEGIRSDEDISKIMTQFKGKVPIMANMVEGGDTPLQNAQALEDLGFSLVIFPGALVRAITHMASRFLPP